MKHYLITPWNINMTNLVWLTERRKLFEMFCLPSVLSQTNNKFEWVIVSDSNTPDSFRSVLDSYPATILYHNFEDLVYHTKTERAVALENAVALPIRSYLETKSTDYIISSRLDNDDAISTDHIDKIQRYSKQKGERGKWFWLNIVRGYKYHSESVYPKNSLSNPFISFIEPQGSLLTTYQCSHVLAPKTEFEILQVREGNPTWMQVIHGSNLLNKLMRFRGKTPFEMVSDRFKIEKAPRIP